MSRLIRVALPFLLFANLAACGRIGYSVEQDMDSTSSPVDAMAGQDSVQPVDATVARDAATDAQAPLDASCPEPQPFLLAQVTDTKDIQAGIDAFNMECFDCSFSTFFAYSYSSCATPPPELADAVAATIEAANLQLDIKLGELLPPAGVTASSPLSNDAASFKLLDQINVITGSDVSGGWYYSELVPCQNCTQGATTHVLWYRDTQHTVVLQGSWYWDS